MESIDIQGIKNRFEIIGNAPQLNYAIKVAAQVANTDMTVLITGESGVGKESFSKIIHQLSARKHNTFIAINCGAIPEGTIDSELFGHEKGAFTGAHDARKGYFEVTNGGTIFLDEIAEMPQGTQARLLRVLENGEFIKVGSSKVQKTDVRVVAATNVKLMKAVEEGKFREDLYYRLNTVPIFVPPLRDRGDDIYLLFLKFASDFADKYKVKPLKLDDQARNILVKYRFPGNIRQLRNIVEQMSVLEVNREIEAETMLHYLPKEPDLMPAIYKGGESQKQSDNFSEREILYKVLFDMRKDVTELKKLVLNLLQSENYGDEILEEHQELFDNLERKEMELSPSRNSGNQPAATSPYLLQDKHEEDQEAAYEIANIEDADHDELEEESLSLEKKEKELIIKALRKNNNKRKYAAQDLGISERTLYRKIKQYDIQD